MGSASAKGKRGDTSVAAIHADMRQRSSLTFQEAILAEGGKLQKVKTGAAEYDAYDFDCMAAGEICETIRPVALLADPGGTQLEELDKGIALDITQTTSEPDFYLQVRRWSEDNSTRMQNRTGWIRMHSVEGTTVIHRRADISFALWEFDVGSKYTVIGPMLVREHAGLQSKALHELPSSTPVQIEEICQQNVRRARISRQESDSWTSLGWVSLCSCTGQSLLMPIKPTRTENGYRGSRTSNVQDYLKAAQLGDANALLQILDGKISAKPNLNASDTRGRTALMLASASGSDQTVEVLLKHRDAGLDLNWVDGTLRTALHHAAMRKPDVTSGVEQSATIVESLLRHKSSLEAVDLRGRTALQLAVEAGCKEVVVVLLHHRANVNANHLDSFTPLSYAQHKGHQELITLLSKEGGESSHPLPCDQACSSGELLVADNADNEIGVKHVPSQHSMGWSYTHTTLPEEDLEKVNNLGSLASASSEAPTIVANLGSLANPQESPSNTVEDQTAAVPQPQACASAKVGDEGSTGSLTNLDSVSSSVKNAPAPPSVQQPPEGVKKPERAKSFKKPKDKVTPASAAASPRKNNQLEQSSAEDHVSADVKPKAASRPHPKRGKPSAKAGAKKSRQDI